MANDPNTDLQLNQPEHSASAPQRASRTVHTQGGDYAEGSIDKRHETFVEGDQFEISGANIYAKSTIYQTPRETLPAFQVPYRPIPLIGRDEALAELTTLSS